jgi:hypothetical protein
MKSEIYTCLDNDKTCTIGLRGRDMAQEMTLQDIIDDIHVLTEDLAAYE